MPEPLFLFGAQNRVLEGWRFRLPIGHEMCLWNGDGIAEKCFDTLTGLNARVFGDFGN